MFSELGPYLLMLVMSSSRTFKQPCNCYISPKALLLKQIDPIVNLIFHIFRPAALFLGQSRLLSLPIVYTSIRQREEEPLCYINSSFLSDSSHLRHLLYAPSFPLPPSANTAHKHTSKQNPRLFFRFTGIKRVLQQVNLCANLT